VNGITCICVCCKRSVLFPFYDQAVIAFLLLLLLLRLRLRRPPNHILCHLLCRCRLFNLLCRRRLLMMVLQFLLLLLLICVMNTLCLLLVFFLFFFIKCLIHYYFKNIIHIIYPYYISLQRSVPMTSSTGWRWTDRRCTRQRLTSLIRS